MYCCPIGSESRGHLRPAQIFLEGFFAYCFDRRQESLLRGEGGGEGGLIHTQLLLKFMYSIYIFTHTCTYFEIQKIFERTYRRMSIRRLLLLLFLLLMSLITSLMPPAAFLVQKSIYFCRRINLIKKLPPIACANLYLCKIYLK